MNRLPILLFGLFCYALFGVTSVFALCFLGNFGITRTIDAPGADNLVLAVVVNLALLTLFAVQHSVMARPWFKRWWTQYVPRPAERSTYMLLSCAALALLIGFWQPMGLVIWKVEAMPLRVTLYVVYFAGWLTVIGSSWLINHYELFGLRQVWRHYRGLPDEPLPFITPGLYRWVRHPLYVGWLIVFWGAPTMTVSHLLFSVGVTVYILLAIRWEERDLVAHFGESYLNYRRQVPMLLPWRWTTGNSGPEAALPSRSLSRTIKGDTGELKMQS